MLELNLIFLFSFCKFISSLNNNTTNNKNYINSMHIIQNTPVDNNIPLIIQELDKNYINQNIDSKNTINSPLYIPNTQKEEEVITNTSIKINNTNKDPMCTMECCMGCQIQFNKLTSQKNCIINICKCQIIEATQEEINIEKNKTNSNNDKGIKQDNTFMVLNLMNNNININDLNEKGNHFYYCFILLIFLFYESYIIFNLNQKDNKFNMIKEMNNINNLELDKNKEKRINEYMEILYDDEELIENLI